MKVTIQVPTVVEITYVRVVLPVRYEEEQIPNNFPLRDGNLWEATIEIDTGRILDWPGESGRSYSLHLKVCDSGTYSLRDVTGDQVGKKLDDYVPHGLIPGKYGDYVNLEIDATGLITNWPKHPDVCAFFRQE